MKQKRLAIAGMTGALLIGAGTGVVLNLPNSAGASSSNAAATAVTTDPAPPGVPGDVGPGEHKPGQFLKDSLSKLVTAGTITQNQADAITADIEANRPAMGDADGDHMGGPGMGDHRGGPGMGDHRGGPGMGGRHGAPGLDAAATALGITKDELRTELEAGKTIAEVATAKGVDVQKVIDALVAQAKTRITDMVNGVKPVAPAQAPTPSASDGGSTTNG